MPDDMTASRASGIGATEQTDSNSEQIAELLDQVRDLLIEDGTDPATAEALTNYARPATPAVAGNLADLMRMGQIATTGKIDTPAGEDDVETSNLEEAFVSPVPVDPDAGRPRPMGRIDGEGKPLGTTAGDDDGGGDLSSMSKAELQAEADSRGVEVPSGATKQEIIDALGG